MKSSDKDAIGSKAPYLLIEFKNYMAGQKSGVFEQQRDERFLKSASLLLEFMSEKKVRAWLNLPCLCEVCKNLSEKPPRLDLLNSAYGSAHLMEEINWLRSRALPFKMGDRVVRLDTGEKGTVSKQFADGEVFLKLDSGMLAQLQVESLDKIEEGDKKRKKEKGT